MCLCVAPYESLVSLAYNPCLAASVSSTLEIKVVCDVRTRITSSYILKTHLKMPILTIARTTAFIPALSPPEVRTASFILPVDRAITGAYETGI
jgi:hypothetical protein